MVRESIDGSDVTGSSSSKTSRPETKPSRSQTMRPATVPSAVVPYALAIGEAPEPWPSSTKSTLGHPQLH